MELESLTNEMSESKRKAAELRQKIIHLNAQVGVAEWEVGRLEERLRNEGSERAASILITLATLGNSKKI